VGNNVLVFAETRDGELRKVAFEAATAGRMISEGLGGELWALVVGPADQSALAGLGAYGVAGVLHADNPDLAAYSAQGYSAALAAAAQKVDAGYVVATATAIGRDFAPRTAMRLDAGLVADITGLKVDGGQVVITRPVYAGKAYVEMVSEATPQVITLRPKLFTPAESSPGATATVEAWDPQLPAGHVTTTLVEFAAKSGAAVDLTEADIIVSGGRGVGGPENFSVVEDLAAALGGVVGASRAAVDAGWRPHSDQVGQTGKVVNPELYVALGISGAIQHLAGMSNSKVIVAVNKDPEAPIFKVANYGIVGDLFKVAPALAEEIRKLKS
jgi:electron transfer flavoprotein alpha subunit